MGLNWNDLADDAPQQDWDALTDDPNKKPSALRRYVADPAISLLKSAIGFSEVPVGLADIVTGGAAGRGAEAVGFRPKEAKAALDELLTPEQQAANKEVQDAEGFLPTVGAMVKNPSTIAHSVLESSALMGGGGVVARGLMKAAPKVLAGPGGAAVAGGIGEGAVGAGSAAEQIRQETPGGEFGAKQALSALGSGAGTAAFGVAGAKLAHGLKISDIDTMIAQGTLTGPAGVSKKGFLRKLAEGAVSEGVFEELPQSAQEQMWQNYALGKPIMEKVPEAAAMGMVVGAAQGGGINAISGSPAAPAPVPVPKPAVPPAEPPATTPHDSILRDVARKAERSEFENTEPAAAPAAPAEADNAQPSGVVPPDAAAAPVEPAVDTQPQANPRELDALRAVLKGEALSEEDGNFLYQSKLAKPQADGSLKILPAGRRRLKALEAAQPSAEAAPGVEQPLSPKTVAGVAVEAHSDEQLQALAANPETPATTRHAAAAALANRTIEESSTVAPKATTVAEPAIPTVGSQIPNAGISAGENAGTADVPKTAQPAPAEPADKYEAGSRMAGDLARGIKAAGDLQAAWLRTKGYESASDVPKSKRAALKQQWSDEYKAFEASQPAPTGIKDAAPQVAAKPVAEPIQAGPTTKGNIVSEAPGEGASNDPLPDQTAAVPAVKQRLFVQFGNERFEVASLEDASRKWEQFRDATGEGASVLGGAGALKIIDQNGRVVGNISYNGRVFPPGEWKSGMKPLYDPYAGRKGMDADGRYTTPTDAPRPRQIVEGEAKPAVKELPAQKRERIAAEKAKPVDLSGKTWMELGVIARKHAKPEVREAAVAEQERRKTEYADSPVYDDQAKAVSAAQKLTKAGEKHKAIKHPFKSGKWTVEQVEKREPTEKEVAARKAASEKWKRDAAERKKIDVDKDSLIPAIVKLGGLKESERAEIIRDTKGNFGIPGVGFLFTKNGLEADGMIELLDGHGYMLPAELADVDGGVQALRDKVEEEFGGGRKHWSLQGEGAARAQEERDIIAAEAQQDLAAQAAADANASGVEIDLAIPTEAVEAEGMTPDAEILSTAELIGRAMAADAQAFDAQVEARADGMTDGEYRAAVVQFLKDHENADQRQDEGDAGARQEDVQGPRVPEGDGAQAQGQDAEEVAPAAASRGELKLSKAAREAIEKSHDRAKSGLASLEAYLEGSPITASATDGEFTVQVSKDYKWLGLGNWILTHKDYPDYPVPTGRWMDQWEPYMQKEYGVTEDAYAKLPEEKRAEIEAKNQIKRYVPQQFFGEFAEFYLADRWRPWVETLKGKTAAKWHKARDASAQAYWKDIIEREFGSDKRPALSLEPQTEASIRQKEKQAETGKVEEQTAAVRDRNDAILTPPEGTAPAREITDAQRTPTAQPGLFGQAVTALRAAADAMEKVAQPEESAPKAELNPLKGDRFTDDNGDLYEVWSQRGGRVEAFRVVNGKMIVHSGAAEYWSVNPVAQGRFPDDRTDYNPVAKGKKPVTPQVPSKPASGEETSQKGGTQGQEPTGLAGHDEFIDRLRDGTVTPAEVLSAFDAVVSGKDALTAELGKLTKDQLERRIGRRYGGSKKDDLVRMAYQDLLGDFSTGESVSYVMGGRNGYEDAVRKNVEALTPEAIAAYAEKVAASRAERKARIAELQEAVKDPQTLDDFETFLRVKEQTDLTPEQLRRYDDLRAAQGRERRKAEQARAVNVQKAGEAVGAQIIETKHTKKGHDLFVVQLEKRVERDDYTRLNTAAKQLGGYYSSYRGGGAVIGFQFTTRENAEAFQKLAGGDVTAATEAVKERRATNREAKKDAAAERLADMADRMEESANERLAVDRLANTARRARMAGAAEAQANADASMARTLRNISDALEEGKATNLDGIRNRKQVEELEGILRAAKYEAIRKENDRGGYFEENKDRAPQESDITYVMYPRYSGRRSNFAEVARQVVGIPGAKMAGEKLLKQTDDSKDYAKELSGDPLLLHKVMLGKTNQGTGEQSSATFKTKADAERAVRNSPIRSKAMVVPLSGKGGKGLYAAVLSPAEAKGRGLWSPKEDPRIILPSALMEEIIEKVNAHNEGKPWSDQVQVGYYYDGVMETRKRLKGMGIENSPELRAALREYIGLRAESAKPNRVKELERKLAGTQGVGIDFFPTPAPLAARMAEALEVKPGMTVLEPSAGKGNLADAVRDAEPSAQIDTVEQSGTLREILEAKGYQIVANDFMEFQPEEQYDRVIMNPPFSNGLDAEHVMRAYGMLKPGGKLVAIAGEGIFTRGDKKATAFREWFDSVNGSSEEMEDAFTDRREVRTTQVRSRLLLIDKTKDTDQGVAMFSQSSYVGDGLPLADAQAVVASIRRALHGAPPIHIHERVNQAPADLVAQIKKAGAENDIEAAFHEGEIYVFPQHIASVERAQFVIGHHEIRHYGLRGLLGPRLGEEMHRIYAQNPAVREATKAERAKYPKLSQAAATEEVLADMPVADVAKLKGIDRLVAAIRSALRSLAERLRRNGLNALADAIDPKEWTDNDVRALIARAEDMARQGDTPFRAGGTALQARRISPTGYKTIRDFVVPETPEYEGNMTGDIAHIPDAAARGGVEALPIRLPVGQELSPHVGQGITHMKANADRQSERAPAAETGDQAEDLARDLLKVLRGGVQVFSDARGIVIRSPSEKRAVVLKLVGRGDDSYYSVVTVRPAETNVWGNPAWLGRLTFPSVSRGGSELPNQSIGEGLAATNPERAGVQTEKFEFNKPGPNVQIKPKPRFSRDQTASAAQWPDLRAALDEYDDPDKYASSRDFLETVEGLVDDGRAPDTLDGVIRDYKEALREDMEEFAGRNDTETPEAAFVDAVRAALNSNVAHTSQNSAFSRASDAVGAVLQSPKVAGFLTGLTKSPASMGVLKNFQTQYHKAEMLARKGMPQFKAVFDRLNTYLTDISAIAVKAEQQAPAIFRELTGIGPKSMNAFFKGAASEKDVQAIGPWLTRGTLYGGGSPIEGVVWTKDELMGKRATNGRVLPQIQPLTEFQAELYRQARAAIDQSLEDNAKAILHRHVAKLGVAFDRDMSLADVAETIREQLLAKVEDLDMKIDAATVRADEAHADHEAAKEKFQQTKSRTDRVAQDNAKRQLDMSEVMLDNLRGERELVTGLIGDSTEQAARKYSAGEEPVEGIVNQVEKKAKALIDHGYMPLSRFGNRTVTAKDAEGKVQFFGTYDGQPLVPGSANREMYAAAKAIKEAHPEWTVTTGVKAEKAWKMYQGLSLEALENFMDFLDPETKAELQRDAVIQEYLSNAVNNRSVLKRLIHRQGTPGFSTDVPRILAAFVTSNARNASGLYNLGEAKRLVNDIPKEQGDVVDEAAELVEYVTKPGEEAAMLRGFLFFHFLGGSVAAAAVNLTQTPMVTAPYLSQHASVADVASAIASAAKQAVQDPAAMTGPLGDALQKAEKEGVTAPQQIYHLTATAANNPFSSNRQFRTFMTMWGGMFGSAEVFNRRVAFIAAYEIANKNDIHGAAAYAFASKAVTETQFIYSKVNRPNLGRGALGATVMTFRVFSISWLELLRRMPPKQQLMMLGMMLLVAGGEGLPFEDDMADAVDVLGQWLGFATNTKKWTGKVVKDTFGDDLARPILKGLGGMLPLDLHSRLGMGNLIPATSYFKQSEIDKSRDVAEAVGPIGSVLKSFSDSLQLLARGKWDRAAVGVAPKALRDAYNGAHMAVTGESQDTKGRLAMRDVTAVEGFGKAIGFNPQRAASEGEAKRETMIDRNLRTVRMDEIASDWADGILQKDADKTQAARDRLRDWNTSNPEMRLNPTSVLRSVQERVRAARKTSAERFLKSTPKPMRADAREALNQ